MLRLSVSSALYPPTHNPHRLSNYIDYEHSLNVEGLNFPIQAKQMPLFEKLNPSTYVNVLDFEESSKWFTVEYRSPERERERHVILLLLEDADNLPNRNYVWIKNMSALVYHRTNHNGATFVCNSCLARLHVSASARRAHTVLFSAQASTGRLSKSPKRKGVRTKVPIEA